MLWVGTLASPYIAWAANAALPDKIQKTRGSAADVVCTFRQSSVDDLRSGSGVATETQTDHVDLGRHVDQVRGGITSASSTVLTEICRRL